MGAAGRERAVRLDDRRFLQARFVEIIEAAFNEKPPNRGAPNPDACKESSI